MDFNQNDRVVVTKGKHEGQSGTIVKVFPASLPIVGNKEWDVKLDNADTHRFFYDDIKPEDLEPNKIEKSIQNITEKMKQASSLPEEMKKELPTHIDYVGDALTKNKNRKRADIEYTYVKSNLTRLSEEGKLSHDLMESIRIDLEKIYGAL